jgi:hypothetical protein
VAGLDRNGEEPPLPLHLKERKVKIYLLRLGREKSSNPKHAAIIYKNRAGQLGFDHGDGAEFNFAASQVSEDFGKLCRIVGLAKSGRADFAQACWRLASASLASLAKASSDRGERI